MRRGGSGREVYKNPDANIVQRNVCLSAGWEMSCYLQLRISSGYIDEVYFLLVLAVSDMVKPGWFLGWVRLGQGKKETLFLTRGESRSSRARLENWTI